ncbi:cytochrome b [Nonomuraea roseola]|uniref:Cytochrome bc1 complex cytochrome b subunit n=1 Tax=Nonomuraea roseola TaxID=46179 RepID=A0ABV5QB72_9ACTN
MATPTRRERLLAGSARAATGTAGYLDDRLGLGRWLAPNLRKLFPGHWSFLLGELALYAFVMLLLTGTFLTLFYKPHPEEAYASVVAISTEVRGGLLVRQLHHWAATVFVLSIVAHLFRVFFTGAFRRPRELTWMIGVTLFALVLFESFLGVSLPADQLGGTGLRQADSLLLSIPLVGTYLSAFLFGGSFPGDAVPRLFVAHVLLVPGILAALVPLHALVLTWRQKHTDFRGPGVSGVPFFPSFVVKQGITSLGTFALISALATLVIVNPVWLHGAYTPAGPPPSAQPFWYYGVLDGALRLVPAWELTLGGFTLSLGLLLPMLALAAFFTVLLLYPSLERRFTGDRRTHDVLDLPSAAPVRTALGIAVITLFTVVWAATWTAHPVVLYGLRVAVLVLPPLAYAVTLAVCRARGR